MIRFRLAELIADMQFKRGRHLSVSELSGATGISRVTLSRMVNQRDYVTTTDTLDKLCRYFECELGELAVYVDQPAGDSPTS